MCVPGQESRKWALGLQCLHHVQRQTSPVEGTSAAEMFHYVFGCSILGLGSHSAG